MMWSHDSSSFSVGGYGVEEFFFAADILWPIGDATGALWFYNISFCAVISIMALCIS